MYLPTCMAVHKGDRQNKFNQKIILRVQDELKSLQILFENHRTKARTTVIHYIRVYSTLRTSPASYALINEVILGTRLKVPLSLLVKKIEYAKIFSSFY